MSWKAGNRGSGPRLVDWLKNDEWRHVAFSSRLKATGGPSGFGRIADGRLWIREGEKGIDGAVFASRYGVILPVYGEGGRDGSESAFLTRLLSSREDRLFSVIGMEDRVRDVEGRLKRSARDSESYRMLTLGEPSPGTGGSLELQVRKARESDFELLWPLEKGYQIEEVLRKGSLLNERFARKRFLEALRDHVVYCAVRDGTAVAKAQTNARGWTFEQIGGVYVPPGFRGKGFAAAVMEGLTSDILSRGLGACLFVKDANVPALRLYEKTGFRDRGAFRIAYY